MLNDFNPRFSPNGMKIVFASDRARDEDVALWVMNADGTGLQWAPVFGSSGRREP